jgi:DNA-binding PadR family transcriptional regulator
VSKSEIIPDLDLRLIHDFMDVLILKVLRNDTCATGYSLIRYFHQRFHIIVSSGTVYSKLYRLERQGFLEGTSDGRRRVYRLTKRGEDYLSTVRTNEKRNHAAFLSIFSVANG